MSNESNTLTRDRSEWAVGPWDDEPEDKIVWIDERTGLDCMMVRNDYGTWCGYVGLPPGHAHYRKSYNEIGWGAYEVHGGLTYSDSCHGNICHVPEPGRPHEVWWIGFDCNHGCDLAPRSFVSGWGGGGEYRTRDYVRAEVEGLARQAKAQSRD